MIEVARGEAPLIVSLPHTGTDILPAIEARLGSSWLARKDADWHVERLYAFAADELGATLVRTPWSRTVIDVNRDPSGASLYPGQATTELCPTTTFDGEPLYGEGEPPDFAEVEARRVLYFDPFHVALAQEVARLRAAHPRVVVYEAHSIRSHVPRLFDGPLPHLNLGVNGGATCDPALLAGVEAACDRHPAFTRVTDGRFKGGWTTRAYGRPHEGVHAIQMDLAIRGYMDEPDAPDAANWPPPYDSARAAPLQACLRDLLAACLTFAREPAQGQP